MTGRVWLAVGFVTIGLWAGVARSAGPEATRAPLRITVVYNNVPHTPGLTTAWGFAAMVATGADMVLFDAGGDGPTLLGNLQRLGIDPASIDAVVLSHIHGDHTDGLDDFLARRPNVTVYLPRSFPTAFRRAVERRGARVEMVSGPQHLFANLHSTGEMGDGIMEQALIIDTPSGVVVMTGCAHPGIVEIAMMARAYIGKDISLLVGGFHMSGRRPAQNRATIDALRKLGVRKIAPSHCTGDEAITMFRAAWGDDFVPGGCGAVIELP
jgi:7,8-dihydropterin-6-yl-methyl-4-(beta-D-ribofuranosyl)aminobenzene 5'-phosphate synthase